MADKVIVVDLPVQVIFFYIVVFKMNVITIKSNAVYMLWVWIVLYEKRILDSVLFPSITSRLKLMHSSLFFIFKSHLSRCPTIWRLPEVVKSRKTIHHFSYAITLYAIILIRDTLILFMKSQVIIVTIFIDIHWWYLLNIY